MDPRYSRRPNAFWPRRDPVRTEELESEANRNPDNFFSKFRTRAISCLTRRMWPRRPAAPGEKGMHDRDLSRSARGRRWDQNFFYLFESTIPIEKSRFEKINVSKRKQF